MGCGEGFFRDDALRAPETWTTPTSDHRQSITGLRG
jgi:hypothetical protein